MLQERGPEADLRRPDDLAPVHRDFAAHGRREAGTGADTGGAPVFRCQLRRDAQQAEGGGEALVNRAVALWQGPERRDRGGDGIGDLVIVPDSSAASRPAYDVPPAPLDLGTIVAYEGRFVSADRQARGRPAV